MGSNGPKLQNIINQNQSAAPGFGVPSIKPMSSKESKAAELPGLKSNKSVAVIDPKKIAPENEKRLKDAAGPPAAAPKELKPIKNQSMIKGSMTARQKPSEKEKSVEKSVKGGLNKSVVSNKSVKSVKSTKTAKGGKGAAPPQEEASLKNPKSKGKQIFSQSPIQRKKSLGKT